MYPTMYHVGISHSQEYIQKFIQVFVSVCYSIRQIKTSPFRYLINLIHLDLSENTLGTFVTGACLGLASLQTLDLSNNILNAVPKDVFAPLANVSSLNLAKNNIKYINDTGTLLYDRLLCNKLQFRTGGC